MAEYTEAHTRAMRERWQGCEVEVEALIPVIRTCEAWHESATYRALMDTINFFPEDLKPIERDLRGVDLSNRKLIGAHLDGAHLFQADLSGANLLAAHLSGADLQKAEVSRANLMSADLRRADLRSAGLDEANLMGAYLNEANLNGASLRRANLIGADFRAIRFFGGADFSHARCWGAKTTAGSLFASYLRDYFRYGR